MALFKRKNRKDIETEKPMTKEAPSYPFVIERKLKGYLTAAVLFVIIAIVFFIITRSAIASSFGLVAAILILVLYFLQKKELESTGFEVWELRVMDMTRLTKLNRKPTGFYAEALTGPYIGKICHVSLASQAVIPAVGQLIELFVPGNLEASPVKDVYYITKYYGMQFISDDIEYDTEEV